jgi:hypothetical protein
VHVKEASVHINDFSMSDANDVGLARKIGFMKTVSISERVDNRTNDLLGFGIATLDSRHIEATLLRG